jgi:hypothetical protein
MKSVKVRFALTIISFLSIALLVKCGKQAETRDQTSISIKITHPADGSRVEGVVQIRVDVDGPRLTVRFYIDDEFFERDSSPPYSINWDTTVLNDGTCEIEVRAYNWTGRIGSHTITVTVDNPQWIELGTGSASGSGISNSNATASLPSVAIDANNNVYIAYQDDSDGDLDIYVMCWDGSQWIDLGNISDNDGQSSAPAIAVNTTGDVYVVWRDDSDGDNEIYVKKYDGNWGELNDASVISSASAGGISNNAGNSLTPSIAIDIAGNIYVAWEDDSDGDPEIYVKRWNESNSTWDLDIATTGGISDNATNSVTPSIAIDSTNRVYVAWEDDPNGTHEIYVKMWDGTNWVELNGSASGGGITNNVNTGNLFSFTPSITVNADGNVYVAWQSWDNTTGNSEIYIKKWDGANWVELNGSATAGGISDNAGFSESPEVTINNQTGDIYLTWQDDSNNNAEIYVKRWDGISWSDVGTSSSTEGGISNNAGNSISPSVAIDTLGRIYVTWSDASGGSNQIYVKRTDH